MTKADKSKDRGEDRAAEAFDRMASPASVEAEENPWKPAALLLLVVALVLPMGFGIRQSRHDMERERRQSEARAEVGAISMLVADDNLPEAVVALHDVGMRLGRIEEAEAAAFGLRDAVTAKISGMEGDIARKRAEIGRLSKLANRQKAAIGELLLGRAERAAEILQGDGRLDQLSEMLQTLALRLAALDRAEQAQGEKRSSSLEILAAAWPLPAIEAARIRAAEDVRVEKAVAKGLVQARSELAKGDVKAARKALAGALSARRLDEAEPLLWAARRAARLDEARLRESAGDLRTAAALYRAVANEDRDEKARASAQRLEKTLLASHLEASLRTLVTEAGGDRARAAVVLSVLADLTKDEALRRRSGREWEKWYRSWFHELVRAGDHVAARAVADRMKAGHPEASAELLAIADRRIALDDRSARLERARAALEDDAAAHAKRLLTDTPAPDALGERIETALRARALRSARAFLEQGNGKIALAALEAGGLAGDASAAEVEARARILGGDIEAGLALLSENDPARVYALTSAALRRMDESPEFAAVLFLRAREITGPRTDLDAAIATILDSLGRRDASRPFWDAVRDAALLRAPLRPRNAPVVPEQPVDETGPR